GDDAGVASSPTRRVCVVGRHVAAGVAAGGGTLCGGRGVAGALDGGVGRASDRRFGGIDYRDGLVASGEVAAIIGGLPGARDDAGVAGARRKGVGVADGHVAAGVAPAGGTLSGGRGVAGALDGGVGRAGDRRLGGINHGDGLV